MSGAAEDWLSFIHLPGFVADWKGLGLDDEALGELELSLLQRPDAGPVVAGTGGLRKARFAPAAWGRGKSGSIRVGYILFLRAGSIVLLAAFGKNRKANLTRAERNAIRRHIAALRHSLGE